MTADAYVADGPRRADESYKQAPPSSTAASPSPPPLSSSAAAAAAELKANPKITFPSTPDLSSFGPRTPFTPTPLAGPRPALARGGWATSTTMASSADADRDEDDDDGDDEDDGSGMGVKRPLIVLEALRRLLLPPGCYSCGNAGGVPEVGMANGGGDCEGGARDDDVSPADDEEGRYTGKGKGKEKPREDQGRTSTSTSAPTTSNVNTKSAMGETASGTKTTTAAPAGEHTLPSRERTTSSEISRLPSGGISGTGAGSGAGGFSRPSSALAALFEAEFFVSAPCASSAVSLGRQSDEIRRFVDGAAASASDRSAGAGGGSAADSGGRSVEREGDGDDLLSGPGVAKGEEDFAAGMRRDPVEQLAAKMRLLLRADLATTHTRGDAADGGGGDGEKGRGKEAGQALTLGLAEFLSLLEDVHRSVERTTRQR